MRVEILRSADINPGISIRKLSLPPLELVLYFAIKSLTPFVSSSYCANIQFVVESFTKLLLMVQWCSFFAKHSLHMATLKLDLAQAERCNRMKYCSLTGLVTCSANSSMQILCV